MAKKLGTTSKTIIGRIKKLEQNKVILGYRTEFDVKELGYKYYKIHISTFNTTPEKIRRLKQFIFGHPNIVFETEALGGYDIELEVQIESEDKLREFLEDLREKFAEIIKDYEVLHYYKEHRLRFFPME